MRPRSTPSHVEMMGARAARRIRKRRRSGLAFGAVAGIATAFGLLTLALLIGAVVIEGAAAFDLQFLRSFTSRFPERAGVRAGLAGTIWVSAITAASAFPVGVAAAIWLEEYAPDTWWSRLVQTNIQNLAGVPSIVYGVLGLALFVRAMGAGRSVLAGGLTLGLLVLPIIVISSREALRAVPDSLREAAYALGATHGQVVFRQVVPAAFPGILTGTILALARAAGEAAPLILVGAVGFIAFTPTGLGDPFTVLPLQIFDWVRNPQPEYRQLAAAASLVLLIVLFVLNATAILLRNRWELRR